MPRVKKITAEQIIGKLREDLDESGHGKAAPDAARMPWLTV